MPADGQAFLDQHTTARASLARERRVDCLHLLPSTCCLESEDAQERTPGRITDALGKVMVPDHVGHLQVFVIDRIIGAHKRERRLVMEIRSLTTHFLMCLGQ
jgi:hypothetical protein